MVSDFVVADPGDVRARRIQVPQPVRSSSRADFTKACVQDLEDMLAVATAGNVACMIAEPIQGVGGFVVPPTVSSVR